jgi:hypothetical protein
MQPYIPRKLDLSLCFSVYFLFCIAKGLAICKFGGVISDLVPKRIDFEQMKSAEMKLK